MCPAWMVLQRNGGGYVELGEKCQRGACGEGLVDECYHKPPVYRMWDQEDKLGPPPWSSEDPKLIAWEAAHGHDVRLKCYVEFGCRFALEDPDNAFTSEEQSAILVAIYRYEHLLDGAVDPLPSKEAEVLKCLASVKDKLIQRVLDVPD